MKGLTVIYLSGNIPVSINLQIFKRTPADPDVKGRTQEFSLFQKKLYAGGENGFRTPFNQKVYQGFSLPSHSFFNLWTIWGKSLMI